MFQYKMVIAVILLTCLNLCGNAQSDTSNLKIEDKVLTNVENPAQVIGGESAWQKFLKKHIDYDTPVFNGAKRGKYIVRIRFVVNKDGSLSEFKALTKYGYGLEEEVIRALKRSPKWTPAFENGEPVASFKTQSVTFTVEDL